MKDEHKILGFDKAQSLDLQRGDFFHLRIYLVSSLWLLTANDGSSSGDI